MWKACYPESFTNLQITFVISGLFIYEQYIVVLPIFEVQSQQLHRFQI